MLILASGDPALYERLEPTLKAIGNPRFFGPGITTGAEVKLIGQVMVFNGLLGLTAAAALKAECFEEPLAGTEQTDFFEFLNKGAGGTRQWDVGLSKGVRDDVWDQGFMIHHALVDALYAAELCLERGLPPFAVMSNVLVALSFAYLLEKYEGTGLATHAVAREFLRKNAEDINTFVNRHVVYPDVRASIQNCIRALPEKVRASVMLDMNPDSFVSA